MRFHKMTPEQVEKYARYLEWRNHAEEERLVALSMRRDFLKSMPPLSDQGAGRTTWVADLETGTAVELSDMAASFEDGRAFQEHEMKKEENAAGGKLGWNTPGSKVNAEEKNA